MLNALTNAAQFLLPSGSERFFISVGASAGALFSFLFGGAETLLLWLMLFVAVDFITGTLGALNTGTWTSHECGLGITKKVLYFGIVALAHGLDIFFHPLIHIAIFEDVVICAYAAGEFGSIIENLERCGLAGVVPSSIRRLIKVLNERVDGEIDKIAEK